MKTRNLLTVLLLCVCVFAFAACGSSSNTSLTGRYVIVNILDDADGTTFAELDRMYKDKDEKITDYLYIEFLSGDRFTLVMFGDEEAKGTYIRDKNTLTFKSGVTQSYATIKGNKITYTYETGAKLVFQQKDTGGLPTWALVIIIVGGTGVLFGGGFALYWFVIRKKKAA